MANAVLTEEQVAERVSILKRFKKLLDEQRAKFRDYLSVLEKQEKMISSGDVDAIVRHTELEQGIISEIYTIQKVIDPLENMYRATHPDQRDAKYPGSRPIWKNSARTYLSRTKRTANC